MASGSQSQFDHNIKLLLIGDSGVGKSCLLLRYTDDSFQDSNMATVALDLKVKMVTMRGKKLRIIIWDTAGQERFRTLTGKYYDGALGIIMVYDVTKRSTFTNLSDIWAKEIEERLPNKNFIKMLVGNKIDKESEREVAEKEGIDFARAHECSYFECSAKTPANVEQCFEELLSKILDTSGMLAQAPAGVTENIVKTKKEAPEVAESSSSCCC